MVYSLARFLSVFGGEFCSQRRFLLMRDIINRAVPPVDAAILRFDVERDLQHHLKVAKQLNIAGVRGTFYFHTRPGCFNPKVMHQIETLDHEVGFHHECLDKCDGDFESARAIFKEEVDLFRRHRLEIKTVCSHGEAGFHRINYKANWELFERFPDLLRETGIEGEVYLWLKDNNVHYAADTFSRCSAYWQTICRACGDRLPAKPLMVLTHLHRWHHSLISTLAETSRDVSGMLSNKIGLMN